MSEFKIFSERLKKALEHNNRMSQSELAKNTGISTRTRRCGIKTQVCSGTETAGPLRWHCLR